MGYYRAAGRHEECLLCARQAMELADELGLDGTVQYGTMLLNAATGYRAAGRYQEAERLTGRHTKFTGDIFPDRIIIWRPFTII